MADTTELVPELLEAGVHFGHQTKRWNPKMKPFIFEQRNQIYIINLDETVRQLRRATDFLQEVARRSGVWAILREPTLAWWHADQSYHDPQEHRPIEIHRADRAVAGIQENGKTRIGCAESRGCKTQAQPRGNPRDVSTARYARGDRHAPGAKRC